MSERVLEVDGVSKEYRLGMIGGGTLHGDLTSWFARVRGKEDPNRKIGMEHYTGKAYPKGAFLDPDGNIVGEHRGTVSYTIGQRKGLGLAMGEPVYVCSKDMAANTVTVGPDAALYSASLRANDWNWFPFPELTQPIRVNAKVRYRHQAQPATVYPEANGFTRVVFDTPQRAITTGQAVVLYQDDLVVGGGTITEVL